MKVFHIIAGAAHGGAETFCKDAIQALHDAGVEQYVICRGHPDFLSMLNKNGITCRIITFNRFRLRKEQKIIAEAVAQYAPNVVHAWMSRAASFVPMGLSVPVLGWFGGYYNLKNYKNCDFYMGVTKDIVRHIVQKTHRPHRAFLVHTFGTLAACLPVKRTDFSIPEDKPIVLLLSRMHWKKGVDTLLQAALLLPDVYFLLAGDGPGLQKYRKMARNMGVADRVIFAGWRNDRAALLGIADVCALPSRYEPFGTVIAESWCAGVPLVATRAAGASQYVTHGVNGLLSDINDSRSLAENIHHILGDSDVRYALVRNGMETYNRQFHREIVTQALIDAYREMMSVYTDLRCMDNASDEVSSDLTFVIQQAYAACSCAGFFCRKACLLRSVLSVSSAYWRAYHDVSLALDVAYIQAAKLYNFRPRLSKHVEILSEIEINRILENAEIIGARKSYPLFTDVALSVLSDGEGGWCAMQGLNLRPLRCQHSALPLS